MSHVDARFSALRFEVEPEKAGFAYRAELNVSTALKPSKSALVQDLMQTRHAAAKAPPELSDPQGFRDWIKARQEDTFTKFTLAMRFYTETHEAIFREAARIATDSVDEAKEYYQQIARQSGHGILKSAFDKAGFAADFLDAWVKIENGADPAYALTKAGISAFMGSAAGWGVAAAATALGVTGAAPVIASFAVGWAVGEGVNYVWDNHVLPNRDAINGFLSDTYATATDFYNDVADVFGAMYDALPTAEDVGAAVDNALEAASDAFQSGYEAIAQTMDDLLNGASAITESAAEAIAGLWEELSQLSLDDLADFLTEDVLARLLSARAEASPLILDINGDGQINLSALDPDRETIYWDLDEDGFAEATGWTAEGDGFLAIDNNADGGRFPYPVHCLTTAQNLSSTFPTC